MSFTNSILDSLADVFGEELVAFCVLLLATYIASEFFGVVVEHIFGSTTVPVFLNMI